MNGCAKMCVAVMCDVMTLVYKNWLWTCLFGFSTATLTLEKQIHVRVPTQIPGLHHHPFHCVYNNYYVCCMCNYYTCTFIFTSLVPSKWGGT